MAIEKCFCPKSLKEATDLLEQFNEEINICAGGTDLFVMMRKGKYHGKYLMDISQLGLNYIRENNDNTISIGAMATLTDVQNSEILAQEPYLFLQKAVTHIGSLQIRNMATLVGNICTGISSADAAGPLMVLDAQVRLISSHHERLISLTDFFESPRKTSVLSNELVTEIILSKKMSEKTRTYFKKVGTRKELFISVINVAMLIEKDPDGDVQRAGIAMGVVAPIPIRLIKTEAFLKGKKLNPTVIDDCLEIMQSEISPRSSHHGSEKYRRLVANNILRSFLIQSIKE